MTHKLFVVDLQRWWKPIVELDCEVILCDKTTWAKHPTKPRRYLLGSSAFYSRTAAERCQLGVARKVASKNFWRTPWQNNKAREMIAAETKH